MLISICTPSHLTMRAFSAGDTSVQVLQQLSWAADMCDLFKEMISCKRRGVPFDQVRAPQGSDDMIVLSLSLHFVLIVLVP
jgi:hypothetical protein